MTCPKCGSKDTTEIKEGIINMSNVERTRGIFCNGCGNQTPDSITLQSPGTGKFNVYG